MKFYKTVLFPIKVSVGEYCWGRWGGRICEHFDNEGGPPVCGLGIADLKFDKQGQVPKPQECLKLKGVTNGKEKEPVSDV